MFNIKKIYGEPIYSCVDNNMERIFVYDSVIFIDNNSETLAIMRNKISNVIIDHTDYSIRLYTADDDYEELSLDKITAYELFRVIIPCEDSTAYKKID